MGNHYLVHESLSERRHRPGLSPSTNAAKRGGEAAHAKYSREYYAHIGRMGGEQTKARYGDEHFARIGKRGAQARAHAKEQGKG